MQLDGVPYEQIAEVLGISVSSVGVRIHRARKKLAGQMKGLGDEV